MNTILRRLGRALRSERGVSTLEYIGLAAVVLILLGSIVAYIDATNGGTIGPAISAAMGRLVLTLEHDGGSAGQISISEPSIGQSGINASELGAEGPNGSLSQPEPNGKLDAECPDCGPNWIESAAGALWSIWNPVEGAAIKAAQEASRIVPYGDKYVKVFKGAPNNLPPGRYLADNAKVTPYTTPGGVFKTTLTSGKAWLSTSIFSFLVNLFDYETGFFNPENKGKTWTTNFWASVLVDIGVGMLVAAAAGAMVAALIGTSSAWLVLVATLVASFAIITLVDWIVCKITGKKATKWLKEGVEKVLDWLADGAKKGWNAIRSLVGA